mmetsp:Transcript_6164/g.15304  ORF Transcript_6164/g.15304 Transcript_6164/m.15304 type:complete len:92 (+) Transcript_6164:205-480(+)
MQATMVRWSSRWLNDGATTWEMAEEGDMFGAANVLGIRGGEWGVSAVVDVMVDGRDRGGSGGRDDVVAADACLTGTLSSTPPTIISIGVTT